MNRSAAERSRLVLEIEDLQRRLSGIRRQRRAPGGTGSIPSGDLRLLPCRAGRERLALLQDEVEHVVAMERLMPVPDGPEWLAGQLSVHGTAIPVIDLCARLARRRRHPEASDFIVVCKHARGRIGLVVQEVGNVFIGARALVHEVSREVADAPYVLGVLRIGANQTPVYSVARLAAEAGMLACGTDHSDQVA